MIGKTSYAVILVVIGISLVAVGDVVILQNGDRVEGEIISDTPTEVLIKRAYKGGNIKFTEKIERSRIARIEKGEAGGAATDSLASEAQSRPSASQPIALTDTDRKELIKVALEQWEKQNYSAAGTTLSRLINGSSRAELNRLSKEVESKIELSLGDMTAEAHLQAAIARSKGQGMVLSYVTDYEKPYLVPRLIDQYEEAIKKPVGADPPPAPKTAARPPYRKPTRSKAGEPLTPPPAQPPASQPSGKTYVLAKLLEAPAPFTGTHEEGLAVARQIRFASSLLTARSRYDSDYKSKPDVKADVDAKKKQLMNLHKELFAKSDAAPGKETKARLPMGFMGNAQHEKAGEGQPPAPGHGGPEERQQHKTANQAQKMIDKIRMEAGEDGEQQNENENNNQ